MGLLHHGMDSLSLKGRRASNASSKGEEVEGNGNDTSQLDKEDGNVLLALISQLRPGMDLSKIALPTFVLEPRSLLERISDFFSHAELVFDTGKLDSPEERFIRVMTMYLSGWHIKPPGVRKPYNPILGEIFRAEYTYADSSTGFYLAEQVSHHPPVSAFFYCSPKNHILVTGEIRPLSRFLGNSAATIMEGEDRIRLLDRPEDGEYCISMPNTYARGILFGKLVLELCEMSSIVNANNDIRADIDFKAKGWISGAYNAIAGPLKSKGRTIGEITGHWNSVIEYTDSSRKRQVLFDANGAQTVPKTVLPESEQEPQESRRLWSKLTTAIANDDMHGATAEKNVVEEHQRELAKKREAEGKPYQQRFFNNVGGNKWMPKLDVDNLPKDPAEMEGAIKEFVFGSADKAPKGESSSTAQASTSAAPVSSAMPPQSSGSPVKSKLGASSTVPDSASSSVSNLSTAEPPAVTTAPGPPAPGPKATHPIVVPK